METENVGISIFIEILSSHRMSFSESYCHIFASDWHVDHHFCLIDSATFSSISCVTFLKQAVVSSCTLDFRCEAAEQQNCPLNDQSINWVHTYLFCFLSKDENRKPKKSNTAAFKTFKVSSSPDVNTLYFFSVLYRFCYPLPRDCRQIAAGSFGRFFYTALDK